jgi:hypothetical protein
MPRYGVDVKVLHPSPGLLKMAELILEHLTFCPTCGEGRGDAGITTKCRDWHERCNQCFARYDQPKNPGCRRRKHPKEEA